MSGQANGVEAAKAEQRSSARIYRIDGTPVSDNMHGIVIEEGQKRVRP